MDSDEEPEPAKKEETGESSTIEKTERKVVKTQAERKMYGPMRPPENYVVPENYFDQETDRDLPEIEEKDLEE